MKTLELRKKWIDSIAKVDERFLRMIDALYDNYSKNEQVDFFEELPNEIQEILLESRESIKRGEFFTHEDVIAESKSRYNITR